MVSRELLQGVTCNVYFPLSEMTHNDICTNSCSTATDDQFQPERANISVDPILIPLATCIMNADISIPVANKFLTMQSRSWWLSLCPYYCRFRYQN